MNAEPVIPLNEHRTSNTPNPARKNWRLAALIMLILGLGSCSLPVIAGIAGPLEQTATAEAEHALGTAVIGVILWPLGALLLFASTIALIIWLTRPHYIISQVHVHTYIPQQPSIPDNQATPPATTTEPLPPTSEPTQAPHTQTGTDSPL